MTTCEVSSSLPSNNFTTKKRFEIPKAFQVKEALPGWRRASAPLRSAIKTPLRSNILRVAFRGSDRKKEMPDVVTDMSGKLSRFNPAPAGAAEMAVDF